MDTLLAASATEGKPNGSKHAVLTGAVLGAVGPLYYSSRPVRDYILGDGLFLWPTGVIMIVTYGHEHDFFGYAVTAISIALNIMYMPQPWRFFGLSFGLSGVWQRAHPNQAMANPSR